MSKVGPNTRIFGDLNHDTPGAIAELIVGALARSNQVPMALIVDERRRVLLLEKRSAAFKRIEKAYPGQIACNYQCGRNPAAVGLTVREIAGDIRHAAMEVSA